MDIRHLATDGLQVITKDVITLLHVPNGKRVRLVSTSERLRAKLMQSGLQRGDFVCVADCAIGRSLAGGSERARDRIGARRGRRNFRGGYMRVALIGAPNCSKSTLFNQVAGYKTAGVSALLGGGTLISEIALGVMQGIAAGVAIVLPHLLPFLFGLGILEDIGYLPRIAFLMDPFMHRMGLHGKAIIPFVLGYGCNVPAVMATRTLEDPRDRYLAAALAIPVACAARLAVVFGLVAFYLGPLMALGLYLFSPWIIALTGRILSNMMPEDAPGLILEMPPYRVPTFKNVLNKAWSRIREFVVEAWPLLIAGSAILAILNNFELAYFINWLVHPLTGVMSLPFAVGVPLIFGVLRKELSLVMLSQALGTVDFGSALTSTQMMV